MLNKNLKVNNKNKDDMNLNNKNSNSTILPADWLQDRRKIREELGGEYKYTESLPKKLGK